MIGAIKILCIAFIVAIAWLAYEAFSAPVDPSWAEGLGDDLPDTSHEVEP